jgi:hypothetical protein
MKRPHALTQVAFGCAVAMCLSACTTPLPKPRLLTPMPTPEFLLTPPPEKTSPKSVRSVANEMGEHARRTTELVAAS